MKALVLQKPGEFALEERPKPQPMGDEVLFRIRQAGVCGTDIHSYRGTQPFLSYPRIVGHELTAEVAEIPANARSLAENLKEGDVVSILPYLCCHKCIACRKGKTNCCVSLKTLGVHVDGGMQEYLSLPAFYGVPAPGISEQDIALVECFAIGFHGVRMAEPQGGEIALVVGTGPIGLGVIHGLKERGIKVIAMDINNQRLSYAKKIARSDHTINSQEEDPEKALDSLTGGEMPSLVFDATGNSGQMMKAFNYVCAGGCIVYVGLVRDDITFSDHVLHAKEITLRASRNATKEDFNNVIAGLKSGRVNTSGFVTHRAHLDEVPAAFASWANPETGCIKGVVSIV